MQDRSDINIVRKMFELKSGRGKKYLLENQVKCSFLFFKALSLGVFWGNHAPLLCMLCADICILYVMYMYVYIYIYICVCVLSIMFSEVQCSNAWSEGN